MMNAHTPLRSEAAAGKPAVESPADLVCQTSAVLSLSGTAAPLLTGARPYSEWWQKKQTNSCNIILKHLKVKGTTISCSDSERILVV